MNVKGFVDLRSVLGRGYWPSHLAGEHGSVPIFLLQDIIQGLCTTLHCMLPVAICITMLYGT